MKAALLVLLVACGGAREVPAAKSGPPDLHWLEGRWPGRDRMVVWQEVGGVRWGVALDNASFEVSVISGAPQALDIYYFSTFGFVNSRFELTQQTDTRATFVNKVSTVAFSRSDSGWERDYLFSNKDRGTLVMAAHLDARAGEVPRVPAIEKSDLAFAADTAKDGAAGWARHFDEHGAMWRRDHRVEGADAIKEAMTKTLATGALTWRPVTSGARGDLGFTLGTAELTEPGGKPEHLTYCTIWKHQADGSWKVLFDIGRPAT